MEDSSCDAHFSIRQPLGRNPGYIKHQQIAPLYKVPCLQIIISRAAYCLQLLQSNNSPGQLSTEYFTKTTSIASTGDLINTGDV